jgi:hypothetical protein
MGGYEEHYIERRRRAEESELFDLRRENSILREKDRLLKENRDLEKAIKSGEDDCK